MSSAGGGPRVRGTRADRHRRPTPAPRLRVGRPDRARLAEVVVALVVATAAIVYAATRGVEGSADGATGPSPPDAPPAELAAVVIVGARVPFVTVIGAGPGRTPSAVILPHTLAFTAPGQGDVVTADVASLPGSTMRVAVSNAIGAWVEHYGVLDLDGLGQLVGRVGGIRLDLTEPMVSGPDVLGPGAVEIDGAGTVTFVSVAERGEVIERLTLVLRALLTSPPRLEEQDLLATDDLAGLGAIIRAARGADVTVPPIHQVASSIEGLDTVTIPDQPAFDSYLHERFGTQLPIPIIVQNGSGAPAIGEAVARRLIPAGFRIVISANAPTFDHRITDVIAEGDEHIEIARIARRALGLGRLRVSRVPSGIGDITIVVGKDFTG